MSKGNYSELLFNMHWNIYDQESSEEKNGMLFLIIRCWDRSQLEYLVTNITSYLKVSVEKMLQVTTKCVIVCRWLTKVPVVPWLKWFLSWCFSYFLCLPFALLTLLFSFSPFVFSFFKLLNECMHMHIYIHLSVSPSHPYSVSDINIPLSFSHLLCLQLLFHDLLKGHKSLFSKA